MANGCNRDQSKTVITSSSGGVSNEIHAGITEACQLKPSELVLNEPEKTREAKT